MDTATSSAVAIGAAVVAREGVQVTSRGSAGGYTRITTSALQWTEVGDILPGQPIYNTMIPFVAKAPGTVPLDLIGGRTYEHFLTVLRGGQPVDISHARFISQIRSRSGELLANFTPILLDPVVGSLKLTLTAYETESAARLSSSGRWDVEMHLDGKEVTVVPVSPVSLRMGVSQAKTLPASAPIGVGQAFHASVVS